MKEISLREMQQIEFALLQEFDAVCKKNGLRYYMDGGTLLGAVCYDGFIPWDDDIDLKMPRPDYEKMLMLQAAFPPHILLDAPRPEHCEFSFLKLIDQRTVLEEFTGSGTKRTGVYIDILPMDGHPADPEIWQKHLKQIHRLNNLFHESQTRFSHMKQSKRLSNRLKGRVYARIYSSWSLLRKLTETAKRYDYDSCDAVGLLVEGDPIRERFQKSWLEPPAMMEFEGQLFPAPNAAEEHLSIFYRKPISRALHYRNLPKIPSGHKHLVYWKEEPCQGSV